MEIANKQIELIHQRRKEGVSYRAIAKELGLKSPNSVFCYERRYAVGQDVDTAKDNRRLLAENQLLQSEVLKLKRKLKTIKGLITKVL